MEGRWWISTKGEQLRAENGATDALRSAWTHKREHLRTLETDEDLSFEVTTGGHESWRPLRRESRRFSTKNAKGMPSRVEKLYGKLWFQWRLALWLNGGREPHKANPDRRYGYMNAPGWKIRGFRPPFREGRGPNKPKLTSRKTGIFLTIIWLEMSSGIEVFGSKMMNSR